MRRHRWPAEDATSRRGISDVALEGAIADLRSLMGSVLNERELGLIRLRYGLNDESPRTLNEIGQVYGVTRERIRQIEQKAVSKLRAGVTHELAPVLEDLLNAGLGALPDHVAARLLGRQQPVWYRQGADDERVFCPRHQAFHLVSRFRRSEPLCAWCRCVVAGVGHAGGRPRRYCDAACKQAAYRARRRSGGDA